MKVCGDCKLEKADTEFSKDSQKRDGLCNYCKLCCKTKSHLFYVENLEKIKTRTSAYQKEHAEERNIRLKAWRLEKWQKTSFQNAKKRANRSGVPFTITEQDIPAIPEYCPIFPHIKLKRNLENPGFDSPSLDRIVPSLGYVPGNIQWICYKANSGKRDLSFEELRLLGVWAGSNIDVDYEGYSW